MEDRNSHSAPVVLVVEDDRSVSRILQFSLEGAGFNVITTTGTGAEALEFLERESPEAVVLDLGVIDRLGKSVLERLFVLQSSENQGPVWVVISALDEDEAQKQYGPLGSHFLRKPFDPGDLVTILEENLPSWIG